VIRVEHDGAPARAIRAHALLLTHRCAARAFTARRAGRFRRHATAFVRAFATRGRALAAVIHRVSFAFLRADVAHVRAEAADRGCELAASAHEAGGRATNLRAVDIECDTARETFDVLFLKAGRCAVVAGDGAVVARVDAGLHALVSHMGVLRRMDGRGARPRSLQSALAVNVPVQQDKGSIASFLPARRARRGLDSGANSRIPERAAFGV